MGSISSLQASFEKIILDPAYRDPLTLLKAIRNGAVYGVKVRFAHALVMAVMFRSGTPSQKLDFILKATRQHATYLAKFTLFYKAGLIALRHASGGKALPIHSLIAGMLSSYSVFGRGEGMWSSVNQQMCFYTFGRTVLGIASLIKQSTQPRGDGGGLKAAAVMDGAQRGIPSYPLPPAIHNAMTTYTWPLFASLSWGLMLWLFETYPDTVQPSLRNTMNYLYTNSGEWDSARNFLWHNK